MGRNWKIIEEMEEIGGRLYKAAVDSPESKVSALDGVELCYGLNVVATQVDEILSRQSPPDSITSIRKIESTNSTSDANELLDLGWILLDAGCQGNPFILGWAKTEAPKYPEVFRGRYVGVAGE